MSAGPACARSPGLRTSPCMNSTPPARSRGERKLAAAALEIVESDDGRIGAVALERQREIGADEAGAAGDQNAFSHDRAALQMLSCAYTIAPLAAMSGEKWRGFTASFPPR